MRRCDVQQEGQRAVCCKMRHRQMHEVYMERCVYI